MSTPFTGAMRVMAATVLVAALAGCSGKSRATSASPDGASMVKTCSVTRPDGSAPVKDKGFNYGNRELGVVLWPEGVLMAGPLPGGGSYADINPDGSIWAKQGWWREVEGRLRITGERLDGPAPALSADIPDEYGVTGFQPTGLTFPTTGCWRVVGSVGNAHLAFVVLVAKA